MEENSSGQGKAAVIPPEIRGWNWGAFFLTWIWGIFNGTFIALLMFIPFVNLVMWFVLGAKGNVWAWQNKKWESVEAFKKVQRIWGICGAVAFVLLIALGYKVTSSTVAAVSEAVKDSPPYKLSIEAFNANAQIVAAFGQPIEMGFPQGKFSTSPTTGSADISFPVTGKLLHGTIYTIAVKESGVWHISKEELAVDGYGDARWSLTPAAPQPAPVEPQPAAQ